MLIRCPECGQQISDQVETCPKCGLANPALVQDQAQAAKRRARRRRSLRIVCGAICLLLLTTGICIAASYRWPVSYQIGTVTSSKITRERFAEIVKEAVVDWNKAAKRTVLWKLPLGRRVTLSLETVNDLETYLTTRGVLQAEATRTADRYAIVHKEFSQISRLHTLAVMRALGKPLAIPSDPSKDTISDIMAEMDALVKMPAVDPPGVTPTFAETDKAAWRFTYAEKDRDAAATALQAFDSKSSYTVGTSSDKHARLLAQGDRSIQVSVLAFHNEMELRATVLHELGHALSLADESSMGLVMSPQGFAVDISMKEAFPLRGLWK